MIENPSQPSGDITTDLKLALKMKEKLFIDDGAQQFRDNGNIIINCGY